MSEERKQQLIETVAEFFGVGAAEVGRDFVLGGPRMQGSLPRYALDAAIRRRVGTALATVHRANMFGQLEDELLGRAEVVSSKTPSDGGNNISDAVRDTQAPDSTRVFSGNGTIGAVSSCGVDLERVDALPMADDVWRHPFYREMYTKAEIAYCLSRENPAEHFAARWCAKEALKKCEPAWLRAEISAVEVVLDEHGAPSLWTTDGEERRRLPVAVSLSHTAEMAVAMVVSGGREMPAAHDSSPPTSVVSVPRIADAAGESGEQAAQSRSEKRSGKLPLLIALVSLAAACWALLRTF